MYDYDKVLKHYYKALKPVFDAITNYKGSDRELLLLLEDRSNRLAFEHARHELNGDFHEMCETWQKLRKVTDCYIERLGMGLNFDPYDYAFALTMYAYVVVRMEREEMAS